MAIGIPLTDAEVTEVTEERVEDLEYMLHIDRAALADFEVALSHIAEEGGLIGAYAALVLDNRARREHHENHAALEAYRYRVDVLGLEPPYEDGEELA